MNKFLTYNMKGLKLQKYQLFNTKLKIKCLNKEQFLE